MQPQAHGMQFRRDCVACSIREKLQKKEVLKDFSWQGRRDSNTQPTVLETVALPLSHSPMHLMLCYYSN